MTPALILLILCPFKVGQASLGQASLLAIPEETNQAPTNTKPQEPPQIKYILSQNLPLLDAQAQTELSQIYNPTNTAQEFEKIFRNTFGQESIRNIQENLLAPDEQVLAVFPSLQLLRLVEETSAGRLLKMKLILAGSVAFLDPWTRANVYSATKMIEVENSISVTTPQPEKDKIIRDSLAAALQSWMHEMVQQSKNQVSPFALEVRSLKPPKLGLFKHKLPGCLLNAGYIQGLQKGMILSKGMKRLRIQEVQENMAWALNLMAEEEPIPEDLVFQIILNRKSNSPQETTGLKVRLGCQSPPFSFPGQVLDADSELIILKSYLSKASHLDVQPLEFRSEIYKKELLSFYSYLNNGADLVDMGIAANQDEFAKLGNENGDLDIQLYLRDRFFFEIPQEDGTNQLYYRCEYAAQINEPFGDKNLGSEIFINLISAKDEQVLKEMAGVREVDDAGSWLTVTRNSLITLAKNLSAATETMKRGAGPIQCAGTVQPDLTVSWDSGVAPPSPNKPLSWRRPSKPVIDPMTGKTLGIFEKAITTEDGLPLTIWNMQQAKLQPGDILRFTVLKDDSQKKWVHLKAGPSSANEDWKWDPQLQLACTALELKSQAPELQILMKTDDSSIPMLWQLFQVEAFEQNPEHLFLQVAWRLRLGDNPEEPIWKTGRRFKDDLTFPKAEIGGQDLRRHISTSLERFTKELIKEALTKDLKKTIQ